ncbi:MAG: hypothetical protein GQ574_02875 [Crocinitomix sp.]|nr:hypothetical protein [Crocinitomix sp.]
MNITISTTGKVNAIALQVMQAVNSEREDHTKTMELLKHLQLAIQETRSKAS